MDNKTTETTAAVEETAAANTAEQSEVMDLASILQVKTDTKAPGANKAAPVSSAFWDQSEDDFEQPKKTEAKKEATTAATTEEAAAPKKLTESVIQSSARTATGMVELTTKMIISPIQNYKFKKKLEKSFTDQQLNKIEEKLIDADEKSLEDDDKRLKLRFERMMAKHQKKTEGIDFKPEEKKDLNEAFEEYMRYTQSSLPPQWFVALAIINTVGKRAIDTFTE